MLLRCEPVLGQAERLPAAAAKGERALWLWVKKRVPHPKYLKAAQAKALLGTKAQAARELSSARARMTKKVVVRQRQAQKAAKARELRAERWLPEQKLASEPERMRKQRTVLAELLALGPT